MRLKSKSLFICALSLGFIGAIPSLLSTQVGNALVAKVISDATESKVYLSAHFSWTKPASIQSMTLRHKKGVLEIKNSSLDQILPSFFSDKALQVQVPDFSLTWLEDKTRAPLQSGLNLGFVSFKTFVNCDLKLSGGKISTGNQTPLYDLKGSINYRKSSPTLIDLQALAGETGSCVCQGKLDLFTYQADVDLTIKNCPKDVLPEFYLKPFITSNFNLEMSLQGSLYAAKAFYNFSSKGLAFEGQLNCNDYVLTIPALNRLTVDLDQPYIYRDLRAEGLKGSFLIKDGRIHLKKALLIEDLDVLFQGSCQKISFKDRSSNNFTIQGSIIQKEDLVDLSSIIFQGKNAILNASVAFDTSFKTPGKINLQTFSFPWIFPSKIGLFDFGSSVSMDGKFTFTQKQLNGSLIGSTDTLKIPSCQIQADKSLVLLENLKLDYQADDLSGSLYAKSLTAPYHNPAELKTQLEVKLSQFQNLPALVMPLQASFDAKGLEHIIAKFYSPVLSIEGIGAVSLKNQDFIFKNNWQGRVNLPSSIYEINLSQEPIQGKISIEDGSSLSKIKLETHLDPFKLVAKEPVECRDFSLKIDVHTTQNKYDFDLQGKIGSSGTLNAQGSLKDQTVTKASILLKNPPLEPLGALHPEFQKAAQFFGKNLSLAFDASGKSSDLSYSCVISSDNINLKTSFSLTGGFFLKSPLNATIKLSSLDLPFYSKKLPFDLKKPCELNLNVKTLSLPKHSAPISSLECDGDLQIKNVALANGSKKVQIDAFFAKLQKSPKTSKFSFDSQGDIYASDGKIVTSGTFASTISIDQLTGKISSPDFRGASILASIRGDNFPTVFLDLFQKGSSLAFLTTLGPGLQAKIDLNQTPQGGSIKASVFGQDTIIKLNAIKNQDRYVLQEDALCQTRISQALSELIFQNKPLGITRFSSSYPVVIRVAAPNTTFSLLPFDLNKLNISDLTLDVGRVTLDADNILPQALSLLKTGQNPRNLTVWFQPIHASINQSIMTLSRFDFLLQDAFQLCLWGDIDLYKKQVGLILGLTAGCLQKAFGISELPANYVLQVPVSGPIDDVKIDSKKAAGKIAKIIALQQGGNLLEQFGGKGGAAAGGLLKELSKIPDGDKKAPPAQPPFPWDKKTSKTSQLKETKKSIRSSDSPVKQLKKMFF